MWDELKNTSVNLYENFILRDLTYITSGSIIIGSAYFAFTMDIISAVDYITQDFLKFIVFLAISYTLGYIIREGFVILKVFKAHSDIKLSGNNIFGSINSKIFKEVGINAFRDIERNVYFMHFAASLGSGFLLSGIIFLIIFILNPNFAYLMIFFTFMIFTAICIFDNRSGKKIIENKLNFYLKELGKKKK